MFNSSSQVAAHHRGKNEDFPGRSEAAAASSSSPPVEVLAGSDVRNESRRSDTSRNKGADFGFETPSSDVRMHHADLSGDKLQVTRSCMTRFEFNT